jgi:hypothetical protein
VVARDDGVELAAARAHEDRVGGPRPADVESAAARPLDRRPPPWVSTIQVTAKQWT